MLTKQQKQLIAEMDRRVEDKVLEPGNAELLKKLIRNAENDDEAINIAALGTTYRRTGMHFQPRLENPNDHTIRYFKKNYEWNKIVSYSNNDLCTGEVYQKLGFNQVSEQIDFYYYDVKHKKILDHHRNDDPEKYTEQNGFLKCYNSGMKKYEILSI